MKFNNETIREAVKEWLDDEKKAESKHGNISNWDTSNVTDMSSLFLNAHEFNSPIEKWDVSNVTTMNAMFDNAHNFNQPLNNWNVSKVEDMGEMFSSSETLKFNQPLGNWNVSRVTNMENMFYNAESFNQDIGSWDVSKVEDMGEMFNSAKAFNGDLSSWDVSSVFNKIHMFKGASAFNQDLSSWDVSNACKLNEIIYNVTNSNGNVSKVTDMSGMKNTEINDNETISLTTPFANTIFSGHPNISFLIEKCDNSSSDFINISDNCINGEFEIPAELKNHIEVLKYDIDTSQAFSNGNNSLIMDIDCTVTLIIKTTKNEAIEAIEKYQEDNDDLRWNISIKWIDADNKEQYLFDGWDYDFLDDIIMDEPCWYEED